MTDPFNVADLAPPKAETEVLSPEGVEERVVFEEGFRITLTGGGKHRVYHLQRGKEPEAMTICDTLEEAKKHLAKMFAIKGMLTIDPKRTIDALFSGMRDEDQPE